MKRPFGCSALLALLYVGCTQSHMPLSASDGGSSDAMAWGFDGGTSPPCPAAGTSLAQLGAIGTSCPASVGVEVLRARATSRGTLQVLTYETCSPPYGGLWRLVEIGDDGSIASSVDVRELEMSASGTADFAAGPRGIVVVGVERNQYVGEERSTLWTMLVASNGEVSSEAPIATEPDPFALQGLAVVPAGDGEPDVYFVNHGALRVAHGAGSSPPTPLDVTLPDETRLVASRSEATTCIVAEDYISGDLTLLRLEGDAVAEQTTLSSDRLGFPPMPVASSSGCAVPYFVADDTHPTLGTVRIAGSDARVGGWRGTVPQGLALDPVSGALFLLARDARWPGRRDLWWIDADAGTCAVAEPVLTFGEETASGLALGALIAVPTGAGTRLLAADVTRNQITIFQPRP